MLVNRKVFRVWLLLAGQMICMQAENGYTYSSEVSKCVGLVSFNMIFNCWFIGIRILQVYFTQSAYIIAIRGVWIVLHAHL